MTTFPASPSKLHLEEITVSARPDGFTFETNKAFHGDIAETEARKLIRFLQYHIELIQNQRERSYARTYTKVPDSN